MIPIMGEIAKRVIVFVLSMVPVIELRGAIPVGWGFKLPLWQTLVLSIGGNILIIPFVILLFNRVLELLRKFRLTTKIANFIEERTQRKSEKVENWVFLGLMLFVAIPLPGTGAWTASMIAGLLQMKMRKAFLPIVLGVICAAVIVTLVTYGVVKIVT
ncbi:MAG: small multi-drug export protein [Ruminococcaceae bacterium]|nr:small multi-drug export protein [Oscillospiraceae bacterium]